MRRAAELTDRPITKKVSKPAIGFKDGRALCAYCREREVGLAAHPISTGSVTGCWTNRRTGEAEDDDG